MRIKIISVAGKMPAWVNEGFTEYQKRLQADWPLSTTDISIIKRTGNNPAPFIEKESRAMLGKIPDGSFVIALDVKGKSFSTETLADKLETIQSTHRHVSILIGGPEGLHKDCLARANATWSLSALTFAHPIVRVILAEQLYRAWSITQNHPYHRA